MKPALLCTDLECQRRAVRTRNGQPDGDDITRWLVRARTETVAIQNYLPLWNRLVLTDGGCWEWTGSKLRGYGRISVKFEGHGRRLFYTHRLVYETLMSPIPDGLVIDHLCRNPACANAYDHLDVVTPAENAWRGAGHGTEVECPEGHPYDDANTYWRPDGKGRDCQVCKTTARDAWRARSTVVVSARDERAKRAGRLALDPGLRPHGVANTYQAWNCRCQPCTDAHREAQRVQRKARQARKAAA